MSRVATVQTYGVERYRLTAPRIVGGIENLCTILIHNGEDAPYIVREGKKSPHRTILIHIDNITTPHNATLQTRMNVLFGHPVRSYEQV